MSKVKLIDVLIETDSGTFGMDNIGKTVFLTREAAEEALKGGEVV